MLAVPEAFEDVALQERCTMTSYRFRWDTAWANLDFVISGPFHGQAIRRRLVYAAANLHRCALRQARTGSRAAILGLPFDSAVSHPIE
jgi:hypothetical protein